MTNYTLNHMIYATPWGSYAIMLAAVLLYWAVGRASRMVAKTLRENRQAAAERATYEAEHATLITLPVRRPSPRKRNAA